MTGMRIESNPETTQERVQGSLRWTNAVLAWSFTTLTLKFIPVVTFDQFGLRFVFISILHFVRRCACGVVGGGRDEIFSELYKTTLEQAIFYCRKITAVDNDHWMDSSQSSYVDMDSMYQRYGTGYHPRMIRHHD